MYIAMYIAYPCVQWHLLWRGVSILCPNSQEMNDNLCSRICLIPLLTHSNVSKNNFLFFKDQIVFTPLRPTPPQKDWSPFCTFHFIWLTVHPSWLLAILNWQREGMKTHSVTGSPRLRTVIQPLFLSWVSWADHMSIRGWKTQYDDHMSSSAKSCTLSAHQWDSLPLDSISAPPFKMRRHKIQKPSLGLAQWAMPILISRPLMGWSTRFATYDILRQSWTQRPFPVEIFHLSMACKL